MIGFWYTDIGTKMLQAQSAHYFYTDMNRTLAIYFFFLGARCISPVI